MGSGLLDDNCFTVSQQQINTKWHYTLFVHVHERSADARHKQKELGFFSTGPFTGQKLRLNIAVLGMEG